MLSSAPYRIPAVWYSGNVSSLLSHRHSSSGLTFSYGWPAVLLMFLRIGICTPACDYVGKPQSNPRTNRANTTSGARQTNPEGLVEIPSYDEYHPYIH